MPKRRPSSRSAALAACAALGAGLAGCGSGTAPGPEGAPLSRSLYPMTLDRPAAALELVDSNFSCRDGALVDSPQAARERYALGDGRLLLWDTARCSAWDLRGPSRDIEGSWTSSALVPGAIPAPYRPAGCGDQAPSDSLSALIDGGHVEQEIGDDVLAVRVYGTLCLGNGLGEAFLQTMRDSSGGFADHIGLEARHCDHVVLRNARTGDSARYAATLAAGTVSHAFSYAGKTCAVELPFEGLGDKPDCARLSDTAGLGAALSAFGECVAFSGFFDPPAAKAGAGGDRGAAWARRWSRSRPVHDLRDVLKENIRSGPLAKGART